MITHRITWLMVVLNALAVFRCAILITRDGIFSPLRRFVASFKGSVLGDWGDELINCPWCLSIWFAAGAVALTYFYWPVWGWVALFFAASGVAGFLSEHA